MAPVPPQLPIENCWTVTTECAARKRLSGSRRASCGQTSDSRRTDRVVAVRQKLERGEIGGVELIRVESRAY